MNIQRFLEVRRDGGTHSPDQLMEWCRLAANGQIPDYQISAWLMAAVLNPLSLEETVGLTRAMAESGERLDLTGLPKPWVDKHSTGGVGDKTTIVLLPLLAACGLTCVKMSGRGLGITGGTVDKLSAVPGFRLDLSPDEMKAQAAKIGLALTGQTPNLAPADKVFYALRDATATVASVPLIVSSILSKKMAGGAETIVLDVKAGRGAFMTSVESARELAKSLTEVGQRLGLNVAAVITDMDQPLGRCVGNALEVQEAAEVLRGVPSAFADFCVQFAGLTLYTAGLVESQIAGEQRAREAIGSGAAFDKACLWFSAQGGDPKYLEKGAPWPAAPYVYERLSEVDGYIADVNPALIGRAVVKMGGGRQKKDDELDLRVGVEVLVRVGEYVTAGQPLARVHGTTEDRSLLDFVFTVGFQAPSRPLFL